MLKIIKNQNIWDLKVDCVVVTVNCEGIMGGGLARQCKEQYPDVFNAYRFACQDGSMRPGKLQFVKRGKSSDFVCLFPTKDEVRKDSTYAMVTAGLIALKKMLQVGASHDRIKSIAIPPLGCGLGNLEWSKVKPLCEDLLSDLSQEVILIEP